MNTTQYLALLRGINVGGKNIIKMTDLKACFETAGFEQVATYIQSGNVLFTSPETDPARLVGKIETALSAAFPQYKARIMLRSYEELNQIARDAPQGFGSQPKEYRYDVLYLRAPLTAPEALEGLTAKPGVDEVFAGPGVLYFSRLIAKASQSHLTRIVSLPIYQEMTIRNWNTTCKLLALMDARAQG